MLPRPKQGFDFPWQLEDQTKHRMYEDLFGCLAKRIDNISAYEIRENIIITMATASTKIALPAAPGS